MGYMSNLICEYEQDNYDELVEGFIKEHEKEYEFFKANTHYRDEEEIIKWFLEEVETEWHNYVADECQNMLCSQADALYDQMKEEGWTPNDK